MTDGEPKVFIENLYLELQEIKERLEEVLGKISAAFLGKPHSTEGKIHEVKVPVTYDRPLMEVSQQTVRLVERQVILEALRRSDKHHGKAAKILGITSRTLYNKMKEYGITE
ncbi:MAG: hypothetical protein HYT76_09160 [Deltaproteobacteria bacterium]|nr:hypothetical protein [Deltaproteobacteria bacterium]